MILQKKSINKSKELLFDISSSNVQDKEKKEVAKKLKYEIYFTLFPNFYFKILPKYLQSIDFTLDYELEIKTYRTYAKNLINFFKLHTFTQYTILTELTCYDRLDKTYRFNLVYLFLSLKFNRRLKIFFKTSEALPAFSISSLFKNAVWSEREVWDLYGVIFINNKDLRRILTDYGLKGHPLRRDFPLSGYFELNYNEDTKRVAYNLIELSQEYRNFNFNSPWSALEK